MPELSGMSNSLQYLVVWETDTAQAPDTKPFSLYTAQHVPLPLRPKVLRELEQMEASGVISKVDQATPWCAGMVVVTKKSGDIRICVDAKPLNTSVLRDVHPCQVLMTHWHS